MKRQILGLALACVTALVFAGCATSHHSRACDYKVIHGGYPKSLETEIQEAAADGWKVVSSGGGDQAPFVILSRPK